LNSISVYITSFNKGNYLSQAITSVLNQSLHPEEIIIVDDGSSDDSRDIINSFRNRYPDLITAIYNEQNVGISKSRNIALKACRGDIVTFLDGDDIFYSNKLLSEYEKLTTNTSLSAVYSNFNYITNKGDITGRFSENSDIPAENNIFINTFMRDYNVSSTNNYIYEMFYKATADKVGLYDENIKLWEDWDFRIRMSKIFQYGYCPEINSAYRKLENGLHNSDPELHYREQIKIYNKNKPLTADLINEERAIISNRVYAKIKYLFLEIIRKSIQEKKIFQAIINSLYFILTFKTRKSISTAYKALIKN